MDCTISALIACFSWSGLYIDSDLTMLDASVPHQEWRTFESRHDGIIETGGSMVTVNDAYNPYGRLAIGYGLEFQAVTLSLEVSHISSIATNKDRGVNALSLRLRWHPFRER